MERLARILAGLALSLACLLARSPLRARGDAGGLDLLDLSGWVREARAAARPKRAGEKLLFIGDSHSWFKDPEPRRFSSAIYAGLAGEGRSVALYAACGASARTWAGGGTTPCGWRVLTTDGESVVKTKGDYPPLASLVRKHAPDRVLIELGDNLFRWEKKDGLLHGRVDAADVDGQVKLLLSAVAGARPDLLQPDPDGRPRCLWIGPTKGGKGPKYAKDAEALDGMAAALERSLGGNCRFIDSRDMIEAYEGADGLHLSNARSAQWGERALERIRALIRKP